MYSKLKYVFSIVIRISKYVGFNESKMRKFSFIIFKVQSDEASSYLLVSENVSNL